VVVVGDAAKGPLILGSSVAIAQLGPTGAPTGLVFPSTTVDSFGRFNASLDFTGPASIEASGYHFDERAGALSASVVTLRAIADVPRVPDVSLHVNVVTHLSEPRARALWQAGSPLPDATEAATAELVEALGVGPEGLTPGLGIGLSLLNGDDDPSAYLFAVSAVIAELAAAEAGASPVDPFLQQWLNTAAIDLLDDGTFTAERVEALRAAETRLEADTTMAHLAERFSALGGGYTVPNLHRVLDQDHDEYANMDDCLPYDGSRWPGHADGDADGSDHPDCGGDDCNDDDPLVFPNAFDDVGNAVDDNCDGIDGVDFDGDGFASMPSGGGDCDDDDAAVGLLWNPHPLPGYSPVSLVSDPSDNVHVLLNGAGGLRYGLWSQGVWSFQDFPGYTDGDISTGPDGSVHILAVLGTGDPLDIGDDGSLFHISNEAGGWQAELVMGGVPAPAYPGGIMPIGAADVRIAVDGVGRIYGTFNFMGYIPMAYRVYQVMRSENGWTSSYPNAIESAAATVRVFGLGAAASGAVGCLQHIPYQRSCSGLSIAGTAMPTWSDDNATSGSDYWGGVVVASGGAVHFLFDDRQVPAFPDPTPFAIRHVAYDQFSVSDNLVTPMHGIAGIPVWPKRPVAIDGSDVVHFCYPNMATNSLHYVDESLGVSAGEPMTGDLGECNIAMTSAGPVFLVRYNGEAALITKTPGC
jgi:hypothetical protein